MNGVNLWCVAESVIEELNESHPNFHDKEIRDLIRLCYIYTLERDIITRAHNNCYGCQQVSPRQRDHMENGCLAEWEDLVYQYYPEAVATFSRPFKGNEQTKPISTVVSFNIFQWTKAATEEEIIQTVIPDEIRY